MVKNAVIAVALALILVSCSSGPQATTAADGAPRANAINEDAPSLAPLERLFKASVKDGDHAYVLGSESLSRFKDSLGYTHEGNAGFVSLEASEGLQTLFRYESEDGLHNALAASETRSRELEAEGYVRREPLGFVSLDPRSDCAPLYEFRFGADYFYTVWLREAANIYTGNTASYLGVAAYVFGTDQGGELAMGAGAPPLRASTIEREWTRFASVEDLVVPSYVGQLKQGHVRYPKSEVAMVREAFVVAWLRLAAACEALPERDGDMWCWSCDPGFAGFDLHIQSFATPIGARYIVMPYGESEAFITRPSTLERASGGSALGPDGAMLENFAFGAPASDEFIKEGRRYQDFTYTRFELGDDGAMIRAFPKEGMLPLPLPRGSPTNYSQISPGPLNVKVSTLLPGFIDAASSGLAIRYTLDGSTPTAASPRLPAEGVDVPQGSITAFRLRGFDVDGKASPVLTRYFYPVPFEKGNYVVNGDMANGAAFWGGDARMTTNNGMLRIEPNNVGSAPEDREIWNYAAEYCWRDEVKAVIALEGNADYRLSFNARADGPRSIRIKLMEAYVDANADGDAASTFFSKDIEVEKKAAKYEFELRLRAADGYGEGVKVPFFFDILAGGDATPFEISALRLVAITMRAEAIARFDGGLVDNGGFEANFGSWDAWTEGLEGAKARWTVSDGAAKMEPLIPGVNDWNIQLMSRKPILLKPGIPYTLSFVAWASAERPLSVRLGERGRDMDGDGQIWGGYAYFSTILGHERKRFTFDFTMKDFMDDDSVLVFTLGASPESV